MAADRPRTGSGFLDEALTPPYGPLAMAHRGGAGVPALRGAENTMRAFRHATGLGYRYLETDVHASSDGVLFAFHDTSLMRVTGRPGDIADHTAAEIARLRVGDEPIPRMEQLLEEFPGARFNIDLKSEAAVAPLADLIAAVGAGGRVCVSSFDTRRIRRFRAVTGGSVTTGAAREEIAALLAVGSRLGRTLRRRAGYSVLQLPDVRGRFTVVRPALVRRVHAAGAHLHVWTVDDPARMDRLVDLGVDGIFTDRTDVLKDVFTARGIWREPDERGHR